MRAQFFFQHLTFENRFFDHFVDGTEKQNDDSK